MTWLVFFVLGGFLSCLLCVGPTDVPGVANRVLYRGRIMSASTFVFDRVPGYSDSSERVTSGVALFGDIVPNIVIVCHSIYDPDGKMVGSGAWKFDPKTTCLWK